MCVQDAETNWQFDIFAFAEEAQGHTLSVLSFHFYQKFVDLDKYKMSRTKLASFVRVIENGYDPHNPYHNRWGAPNAAQDLQYVIPALIPSFLPLLIHLFVCLSLH